MKKIKINYNKGFYYSLGDWGIVDWAQSQLKVSI